jgi:methylthioribose-1-phosphate isomerase
MRTVFWEDHSVKMIDQRLLPGRFEVVSYHKYKEVAQAIQDMVVRGACHRPPARGLALAS